MESIALYLLKSGGLLLLFFVAYHFLLRKETFFTSNRWFLLAGLITSALLPLLFFTKIIWVEPIPVNYDWSSLPMRTTIEEDHTEEYIYLILALTYCIAVLSLLAKFGFDFYNLQKVFKGKTIQRQADFKFIDVKENLAPFSFFNTIVYNSSLYSSTELESIIEHEKVHSEQHHTIDVLISSLFCIVFWFNPIIWFYKKAILQNLEFIADSEALKKISDKKAYQITLLKITTQENCVAITNHFFQSLIKKRIVMLNKNQSKKRNSWKYFSVGPALIAFVILFQVKVVAQETRIKENKEVIEMSKFTIDKNTPNTEFKENSKIVLNTHDVTLLFSNIRRNSMGEITSINASYDDHIGHAKKYVQKNSIAISPFGFLYEKDKNGKVEIRFFSLDEENKESLNLLKTSPITAAEANIKEKESTKKIKTIMVNTTNNKDIDADTEIFIDGKKVSKEEMDSTNPDNIRTMNVSKNNGKSTIKIVTNKNTDDIVTELNLEKIDATNLNGRQTTKTIRTVEIVKKEKDGIPIETEIFIDGIKSSKKELDKLDPTIIEKMDVNKSSSGTSKNKTIRIITKEKNDIKESKIDIEQAKKEALQSRRETLESRRDSIKANKGL